jgi:GntR family transcriptional repressor for pyruvate dehydrogenase complex
MGPMKERSTRPTMRKDKLSTRVAQTVLRDITRNGLTLGDHLPNESAMLDEYGVGRGTLREALRVLETLGLISLKPGPRGGPVVESVHPEDFGRVVSLFCQFAGVTYREVVEARLILEPVAARLAAERQAATADSRDLLALANGGSNATDVEEYLSTTGSFHASVVALSGNSLVTLVCQSLAAIYRDRVRGVIFPEQGQQQVHATHSDIAAAIVKGDGALSESLMANHMVEYAGFVAEKHPSLLDEVVTWQNQA